MRDDQLTGTEGVRRVLAVIVTHNSAAVIETCLDSLASSLASEPGLEVVVVDNGSSDESVALARQHTMRPTVIEQANLGYAAGINTGISYVADDTAHVLVLNPDITLDTGAVSELVDAVEGGEVGIAVPRLVDGEGELVHSLRREPTVLRSLGSALLGPWAQRYGCLSEEVASEAVYNESTFADWATGAALLISSECCRAVGPWDERYFLYSEETDYALRARDQGFRLRLVPSASAVHLGGESTSSPRLWSLLTINRMRLQRRRRGSVRAIPYAFAVGMRETIRAVLGRPTSRAALTAIAHPKTFDVDLARARDRTPGFVLFAGLDWWYHNQAHSDFQIFKRVAQARDVLVVNSIGMRMPTPGRVAQPWRRIVRKVGSIAKLLRKPVRGLFGFNVFTPLPFPFYGHAAGRALNAWLVRGQVRVASTLAGISDPVLVVTVPTAVDAIEGLPRRCLVYNRSDKHSEFVEADQGLIRQLEERLLRESDLVVYASHALMDEDRHLAEGRQMFLDHGVDLDHFDASRNAHEPADLAGIPRPRVGFFGGLDDYLVDFELIRDIARALPHAHVVLIGDQHCSDEEIDSLVELSNVSWLGYKPYLEIPAYGAAFDVAIMPWQDNEWIRRSNPIKLKEYLALGLPVVSTDFPELKRYAGVVSIATGRADFVARVARAIEDGGPGTPESRRAAVADASWDRRAADLMATVDQLVNR